MLPELFSFLHTHVNTQQQMPLQTSAAQENSGTMPGIFDALIAGYTEPVDTESTQPLPIIPDAQTVSTQPQRIIPDVQAENTQPESSQPLTETQSRVKVSSQPLTFRAGRGVSESVIGLLAGKIRLNLPSVPTFSRI